CGILDNLYAFRIRGNADIAQLCSDRVIEQAGAKIQPDKPVVCIIDHKDVVIIAILRNRCKDGIFEQASKIAKAAQLRAAVDAAGTEIPEVAGDAGGRILQLHRRSYANSIGGVKTCCLGISQQRESDNYRQES